MKATASRQLGRATESLYEADFHAWTRRTADLLRARRFEAIDIEHTAEEIEDMGKRDAKELSSRMRVLLLHLLKWQFQPRRRSRSWAATIAEQRDAIADDLGQSPSLRAHLNQNLADNYRRAVRRAVIETGMARERFPTKSPYTIAQILDDDFLPE